MSKKERRVTLIRFDQRRIRRLRPLARLVSGLLPWCGPLSLLAGCAAMALEQLSLRQLLLELRMTELLVALALALPGIALHEIGHMVAAVADGCAVDEVGFYVCGWRVTSAYVSMDKHRNDRSGVQQALAGVRAESLYAGVLLLLGTVWNRPVFVATSVCHIFSITEQLLPLAQHDGEAALSARLGVESIAALAKITFAQPVRWRQLLHRGADGRRALVLLALVRWAGFLAILLVVLFAVFQVLVLFLC